jgi:carbon storage regulator
MLVLSRKLGQTVYIGDEITVRVVEVKGGRVKIGIVAPEDVDIFRGELGNHQSPATTVPFPERAFGD